MHLDHSADAQHSAPAHVLLAEDNILNQRVVTLMLRTLDLTVDIVDNGLKAVEACASGQYSIVLMDIEMPVMDGLEATRRIISQSSHPAPYVIAYTASACRDECLAAGMDNYLRKPVKRDELARALAAGAAAVAARVDAMLSSVDGGRSLAPSLH
jgi:CheY-like chemotaxis protein